MAVWASGVFISGEIVQYYYMPCHQLLSVFCFSVDSSILPVFSFTNGRLSRTSIRRDCHQEESTLDPDSTSRLHFESQTNSNEGMNERTRMSICEINSSMGEPLSLFYLVGLFRASVLVIFRHHLGFLFFHGWFSKF